MYTSAASNNKLAIIKALYFNGIMSCMEMSKVTHTSVPNVAKNVAELIEAGYIEEKGLADSKGGRKPVVYSLVAKMNYIVAVAQDQFFTRMCIVDLHNNIVTDVYEHAINLKGSSSVDLLIKHINTMIEGSRIDKSAICCAGISMPGFVDTERGVNHTFMKTNGVQLRSCIADSIGIPVFIDNDSSAIALAELKFGAGRKKKEVMVINLGWGVGLGMIVNGEIFRGFNGFAGEFSHIPIFNNNKRCTCGKLGCLETEASLIILQENVLEAIKAGHESTITPNSNGEVSFSSIIKEANKGDSLAIKAISDIAYFIGQGISILIHIMNAELIVLSGKGAEAGKLLLPPIQQAINDLCIPTLTEGVGIEVSTLGTHTQLIGSAALAMDKITLQLLLSRNNNSITYN